MRCSHRLLQGEACVRARVTGEHGVVGGGSMASVACSVAATEGQRRFCKMPPELLSPLTDRSSSNSFISFSKPVGFPEFN